MEEFARHLEGDELKPETLAAMSREELEALYLRAKAPHSLEALDGEPRGYLLDVAGLSRTPLASLVRLLGTSASLPWEGKTFRGEGGGRGEGINRMRPLGEVAPFVTSIEASAIDGAPCVVLDYGQAANPWPIRAIRDELREVSPGLLFGPAMVELWGRRVTFLYFALEY
jgi:hypothetical protein